MTDDAETVNLFTWLATEANQFNGRAAMIEEWISANERHGIPVRSEIHVIAELARSYSTLCDALAQHPSIKFMPTAANDLMEKELPNPPD